MPSQPSRSCLFVQTCLTHQDNNVPHVLEFLRMEESGELVLLRSLVSVQISRFKPALVSGQHLLKAELIGRICKLFWVRCRRTSGCLITTYHNTSQTSQTLVQVYCSNHFYIIIIFPRPTLPVPGTMLHYTHKHTHRGSIRMWPVCTPPSQSHRLCSGRSRARF